MNTVKVYNKQTRRLEAMVYAMRCPSALKKTLQNAISFLYQESINRNSLIKQKPLNEIVSTHPQIILQNFISRGGNVSYIELLSIASILAQKKPRRLLEIGTFDGNTTLQMGLNTTEEAIIHTIDLPPGTTDTLLPVLEEDITYIQDLDKRIRKYVGSPIEKKVIQHFGDSTCYDFTQFTSSGLIDFCFIDAGHSYECVKSDTEHTLKIMSPEGIIIWHDFTPNCPGVYKYLSELSATLPLIHIAGTTLVMSGLIE
jgi:predicted O-methyltransferase YrrM